jgi:hypothetical protein
MIKEGRVFLKMEHMLGWCWSISFVISPEGTKAARTAVDERIP